MEMIEFLLRAKNGTYAAGSPNQQTLADGCKELVYAEGDRVYRDRYFGYDPFVGEEVVLQQGQVIWSMNYYGYLTAAGTPLTGESIYGFLMLAMRHVQAARPFRGPAAWREGDFEYLDQSSGGVERFEGVERILWKGGEVYRLVYHGGAVRWQTQPAG